MKKQTLFLLAPLLVVYLCACTPGSAPANGPSPSGQPAAEQSANVNDQSDVPETSDGIQSNYEQARTFLGSVIDDLNLTENPDDNDPNYLYCYWSSDEAPGNLTLSNEVLIDGKRVIIDQSTEKELEDFGFNVEIPMEMIEPDMRTSVTLRQNGKAMILTLKDNNTGKAQPCSDMAVNGFTAGTPDFTIPFEYAGITMESTLEDALKIFGTAGLEVTLTADGTGTTIALNYSKQDSKDEVIAAQSLQFQFAYHPEDNSTELTNTLFSIDSYPAEGENTSEGNSEADVPAESIDYMALVNKLNPLPDGWEDALETEHFTNSVGDDVEVEKKAYAAYLDLKDALEKEDIHVDLDSARRSVAEQQRIMDDFTEKYGADYAFKTVAKPGYSEHHTGLALDLYLIIDGKDIVENEDMIQYPEIWEKIHAKLADYGFILRYLEGREHITGYGYEPWHIRYIDNTDAAKDIMQNDITFEEYLGAAKSSDVTIDYGDSKIFTENELKEAVVRIKCDFASWPDCELKSIRYAGDDSCSEETLAWLGGLGDGNDYTQCAKFLMDFRSDKEYTDYEWWLARTKDGGWDIVTQQESE